MVYATSGITHSSAEGTARRDLDFLLQDDGWRRIWGELLNCLHCIHGAELHILHILSFVCIASDLRWSDGLPVTLNKREAGSIFRLLCNWVVCASIMG